ncbi:MAG: DedA family protein [Phycisphaerales bacterium]|nr:DedA family protein [Phycisphaerales bacterium]
MSLLLRFGILVRLMLLAGLLLAADRSAMAAGLEEAGGTTTTAGATQDPEAVRTSPHAPDKVVNAIFNTLGPFAVFLLLVVAGVGLHLPEDLIIIPAGWEMASGTFSMVWTPVAAYLGVVLGDTGWFVLCRRFGPRLMLTRWFLKSVHPRRILVMKNLLERYGLWVLLVSRFIPGARTASVAVAGLIHLKWRIFLSVELPMAATTVAFQLGIGYFAQKGLVESSPTWHWVTLGIGLGILFTATIAGLIFWRRRAKKGLRLPRAHAGWLREVRGGSRAAMRRRKQAEKTASPAA